MSTSGIIPIVLTVIFTLVAIYYSRLAAKRNRVTKKILNGEPLTDKDRRIMMRNRIWW
jgi:hypothetical protein